MVTMRRRRILTTGIASLVLPLAGCAETDDESNDQDRDPETETTEEPTPDVSSAVEVTAEETGLDPISMDDKAPGYHEYEVTNNGDRVVKFYVHVAFYDANGNRVLCNSYYHILPPGESDSEYSNPATESFAEAEIVDIVAEEEAGPCA